MVGRHYFPSGLQLPSQPQRIIAFWPVQYYAAWQRKQMCLNN